MFFSSTDRCPGGTIRFSDTRDSYSTSTRYYGYCSIFRQVCQVRRFIFAFHALGSDLSTCSFYNTVWLILNDITIGTAFGSFLCENHVVLARMLNYGIEVISTRISSILVNSETYSTEYSGELDPVRSRLVEQLASRSQAQYGT